MASCTFERYLVDALKHYIIHVFASIFSNVKIVITGLQLVSYLFLSQAEGGRLYNLGGIRMMSDRCIFHPDESGKIMHIGANEVRLVYVNKLMRILIF